jgi:hypothetical protein
MVDLLQFLVRGAFCFGGYPHGGDAAVKKNVPRA